MASQRNFLESIAPSQLEYLVSIMELNPNLNTGVLTPTFIKTERKRQCLELSENLNAQRGPQKNCRTVEEGKYS